jgi:hypothetical protein
VLARVAGRTLTAAAGRGDRNAIEAVWRAWLRRPDDERWELLTRWRGTQPMAEAVFAAGADPARPAEARATLGAFCASRALAPGEPPERAKFYVLTGQPEQHRAADPDGSALAAAYRAADEPVRAALRKAMALSGGLDPVHVIAAGGAEVARGLDAGAPSGAERAYLTAELARRRDWPRLWRLAVGLPLAEASAAARLLPAGWRAPDEAGRRLLTRLAAASPAGIAALATPVVTRLDIGMAEFTECQFATDDGDLAVRVRRPGSRRGVRRSPAEHFTAVYALPGGRQLETLSHSYDLRCMLHLGAATLCAEDTDDLRGRLVRHVRGHGVDVVTGLFLEIPELAWVRDGFVLTRFGRLWHGTAEPGSRLRDITRFTGRNCSVHLVASEPRTGRVAVVVTDGLVVLGPDFEVIAQTYDPPDQNDSLRIAQIGFCGPSVLITSDKDTGRFQSWQVGPPMTAQASTVLPHTFPTRFQSLPAEWLIVIEPRWETRFFREYLDARTLQPVACPALLDWARHPDGGLERFERLYPSPDGGYAALTRLRGGPDSWAGEVEVRNLAKEKIRQLVSRPLARARPADLAAVTDLATRAGDDARAGTGLLRACLEYQFGADVAVGQATRQATADDDIALAGD